MDASSEFVQQSRHFLMEEYLPKIERCLGTLNDEEVWWRPNEHSNSIGNLVMHLAGNVRQYVVSGVGGERDIRQRDDEFLATEGLGSKELAHHLSATLKEVDAVLAALDHSELLETRTIQGRELTVLGAIYHAVEHFSMHTGQIIQITKQLRNEDLKFYAFRDGAVQRNWHV